MNDVAVDPTEEHPLFAVSGMIEAQECDHTGHYQLVVDSYVAIRMCVNCGKSWRFLTQGCAEWELIREEVE